MNLIGNINAIPFRRFRGGGGVAPFPSIPGMIARYSALGLTNEQMKENPVWVDKTGNGHDLRMKNFLWGGMSGVGGYEMNFNLWTNNVPSIPDISMSTTTTSVSVSVGNSTYNNNLIYIHMNNWDINKNHWLKVTSTYEDGDLVFKFYNDNNSKNIELPANGYVNIPAYPEFKGNYMYISTTSNKQGSFTIEQLPLYPGFILGDGVDDEAATIDNLDLEDTYTVYTPLILLKYGGVVSGKSSAKDFSLNTVVSSKSIGFDSANAWSGSIPVDLFEFVLVVCKRDPKTMYVKDLITGKANQRNSKEFVPNPGKYFIWRNTGGSWCQVAIAGQIICNGHFSTDEDDEKVLDWYKKQYPWLFFDQAWTVVGKTNEDEDRATITNITGNGNDLVLSNFGFVEGSGYNEEGQYAGYLVTDGVDDKIVSAESIAFTDTWTIITDTVFLGKVSVACGILASNIFTVYNYQGSGTIAVTMGDGGSPLRVITSSIKALSSDGTIYDAEWNEYHVEIGIIQALERSLKIGTSSNETSYFCQLAFKFLGIYNNQILSKDDCIKAYNYLQTLKAK